MRIFLKSFIVALVLSVITSYAGAAEDIIRKIIIENNQRIEPETILSYIKVSKGDRFDQKKVNTSLKNMFATGLFSDISVSRRSGALVIKVVENPIINKVTFEGNKRINEETLKSEIGLHPRSVYTKSKVQNDTRKILGLYRKRGRFSIEVEPQVVTLDQNRVNLIFEIEEGKKTTVGKIYFVGNEKFDDDKLSKTINTKESRWYSFYSGNDTYDPDRVAFDKELLRKLYISKGYADFRAVSSSAEITKDKKHFILTFTVEEGGKYKFGKIDVSSQLPNVQVEELEDAVHTKEGETFNANLVDKTIEKMTNHLNDMGYAFVDINAKYKRNKNDGVIGISYEIAEGPKVYINTINIRGNVRTYDKVIRREFRIAEGDPFNAAKIRRSKQRIRNLGFFDKVEVNSERTEISDKADINVDISEKSTGELSFGAGFSTNDGALGNVSIREKNLLGKGQDLKLSFQKSSRLTQVDLGFTEPYFLGKDISAGFDLFNVGNNRRSESSFQSKTQGGALRASYSLTEHLRHSLKYSLKTVDVGNIQAGASTFIREQQGENTTSSIGHTLVYDKRDNRFDPTEGYFARISQTFAGLGGDSKYIKHEISGGYYKPIYREDVILNLTTKGGHITGFDDKNVRVNERFFIGGRVLRGFKYSGIGPRDKITRDALGGNMYYMATAEVSFPLGLPDELGFKGSAFVEGGSLFDVDDTGANVLDKRSIRASTGVGISWSSPLGPIRIDIAHPFASEDFDRKQNVRFNFGTRF